MTVEKFEAVLPAAARIGSEDQRMEGVHLRGGPVARPRFRPRPTEWPAYLMAVAAVVLATALAWVLFPAFELANIIMIYLLAIVAVSLRTGRGPSVLASTLSVAAFDFFFVPPYLTFAVSDTQYLATFGVMLLVALVISGLTVRIQGQAEAARQR